MPPSQEPAGHRYALPSGSRVGDYRIEGFLGAGSFGITYLATDEKLGRRVAIKEYLPSDWAFRDADGSVAAKTQSDAEDLRWGLERFAEEARSLARFDHPNVVRVHRYFTAHDTGFLVMEYVDGGSLGDLLRRKGTLTEAEIERHVLPVLDGLEELHEAGLLHRDIKPDNIALRADGSPVLVDFGAAREEVGARSRALTSLVTPRYSPLEQYSTNAKQGPATDLYAFAAVLYRCITGRTPVDAANRSLGEEQVPVAEAAKGSYGAGLLAAVNAALSPRMAHRPQSIGEFRTVLGRTLARGSAGHVSPLRENRARIEKAKTSNAVSSSPRPASIAFWMVLGLGLLIWLFTSAQELDGPDIVDTDPVAEVGRDAKDEHGVVAPAREAHTLHPGAITDARQVRTGLDTGASNQTPMPLNVAMKERRVAIESVTGTGGSSGAVLAAVLANRTPVAQRILVHLETPLFFRNRGETQNMAVTQVYGHDGRYWLSDDGTRYIELPVGDRLPVTFVAYCVDFDKENPGATDTFDVEPLPQAIAQVMRQISAYEAANPNVDTTKASQLALWVAQGETTHTIADRFSFNEQDKAMMQAILGTIPVTSANNAAPLESGPVVDATLPEPDDESDTKPHDGPAFSAFTRNSHANDLLRVQGTPSRILRNDALDYETWHFGRSTVVVDSQTRRVLEWDNEEGGLKVQLLPGSQATSSLAFTRTSHADDVLRLQGTPSRILRYGALGYEAWHFGRSSVEIDFHTHQVLAWDNQGDLKVQLLPGRHATSSSAFTWNSHSDDVLRLQGTPSRIQRNDALGHEIWHFGRSMVEIDSRVWRVLEWHNDGNLKIQTLPDNQVTSPSAFTRDSHADDVLPDSRDALQHSTIRRAWVRSLAFRWQHSED